MGKYACVLGEEYREPRKRSWAPWALPVAVAAAVFPFLYEGGLLLYARWRTMFGTYTVARTPVLDWVSENYRSANEALRYQAPEMLHTGQWQPIMAVPVVIAVALFGCLFLRRGN